MTAREAQPGQFKLLVRGFLARMSDNDVMAPGTDLTRSAIWLLAFLMTPGFMVAVWFTPNHRLLLALSRRIPDIIETTDWRLMAVYIGLTMSAAGLVAAAVWDALTLQRRDCLILFSLPVRMRTVIEAKLASLLIFSGALAVGTNLPAVLFYGLLSPPPNETFSTVVRVIVSMLAVTAGAHLFVFWAAVAVQGVLQMIFDGRALARASEAAQWALAFVSLLLFLVLLLLAGNVVKPLRSYQGVEWPTLFWTPLLWFLGLYEWMIGSARPAMRPLGTIALVVCAAALVVALATYVFATEHRVRRMIEQPDAPPSASHARGARLVEWIGRLVSRTPAIAAIHLFAVRSFMRSRVHRLGLSAALGFGFALVTYGMLGRRGGLAVAAEDVTPALLSIPLVMLFCGVCGMRLLFALPTEPPARWCFELSGDTEASAARRAARGVILTWIVLPIALVTAAAATPFWGVRVALLHALYCALLGAALTEACIARLRKIPFTCRWIPGAMNFKATWPICIYAFTVFAYRMATLEAWLLESTVRWAIFCASAALAIVIASAWSAHRGRARGITFDESLDPFIQQLNLQRY